MDRREDVGEVYPGGGFAPTGGGARPDAIAELAAEVAELAAGVNEKVSKGDFSGLELPDTATQKEVRQMLQTVLTKLKGLTACAAVLLSFAACAIDATTAWEDVPPTNKVKDVVAEFAPTPGNYPVVSNAAMSAVQPIALTNDVCNIVTNEKWVVVWKKMRESDDIFDYGITDVEVWWGDELLIRTYYQDVVMAVTNGAAWPYSRVYAGSVYSVGGGENLGDVEIERRNSHDLGLATLKDLSAYMPTTNAYTKAETDAAIAATDTSYRRFAVVTNVNQSVQYVTLGENETTLAIEIPANGETKDWIVYVFAATNATISLPPATWYMADTANTNAITAGMTAFYFSQIASGVYILGRQELESVAIP